MAKSRKLAEVQMQTVTAESWRKWFEDGHAPLWIAALLTMDILPSDQVAAALDRASHPWHADYRRRKLALERNYGLDAHLPAIQHIHQQKGAFGRIAKLSGVCAFALDKDWQGVEPMIIALAPELLDQMVEADDSESLANTDQSSGEETAPVVRAGGIPSKPSKGDAYLIHTIGGLTLLLERVLGGRYRSTKAMFENDKINMSAVAKEIEALLDNAPNQGHSAIGRRISAGLQMINRNLRTRRRSDPTPSD